MSEIKLTKLQAAQRQIDAGIGMLFRNDDPVVIHTVAMAAFRLLRDLVKQRGLEDPVDSMIRPGKEKEFWREVGSFANFLKHADKDPGDISDDFSEETNDVVLLLAARYYDLLGCQQTKEMQTLTAWYITLNPNVLSQDVDPAIQAFVLATSGGIRPASERTAAQNWLKRVVEGKSNNMLKTLGSSQRVPYWMIGTL